jgi:hypothetical protein
MTARQKNFSLEGPRPAEPETRLARKTPEIIGTKANESATKTEQNGKKVERKWKETGKKVKRNLPCSRV